tara:strand:+ start:1954 stop:2139 length:186 start_codon:yes stop_codon:yes gene_type:complete
MKSLKNYKYKMLGTEAKIINEIAKILKVILSLKPSTNEDKINKGTAFIRMYQNQFNNFRHR